jgi:hypothetical protein
MIVLLVSCLLLASILPLMLLSVAQFWMLALHSGRALLGVVA